MTVNLSNGALTTSVSEAEFYLGKNKALIGNEIIYFRDAVLTGSSSYEISHLLRGRHGTHDQTGQHGTGQTFLLLNAALVVTLDAAQIGVQRHYKGLSIGQSEEDIDPQLHTIAANRLKPLAVVHAKAIRQKTGVQLTWLRRTRLNAEWKDAVDAPLGEESERYRVQLLTASGGNVLDTLETTSPACFIDSATITTHYADPEATLTATIMQVSASRR